MQRLLQSIGILICSTTLLFGSFSAPASAIYCPKGVSCPGQCDDFAKIMEERTPFYYTGDFDDSCIITLSQAGIRVREEGTGSTSVYILTTNKPFPFRSEWVGRKGRTPDSWYFEQYKA